MIPRRTGPPVVVDGTAVGAYRQLASHRWRLIRLSQITTVDVFLNGAKLAQISSSDRIVPGHSASASAADFGPLAPVHHTGTRHGAGRPTRLAPAAASICARRFLLRKAKGYPKKRLHNSSWAFLANGTRLLVVFGAVTPKRSIVDYLAENASRNPDRVAIYFKDRTFTLREVEEAARALPRRAGGARHQAGRARRAADERSPEMMFALLGMMGSARSWCRAARMLPAEGLAVHAQGQRARSW